jgi:hypothetical protein
LAWTSEAERSGSSSREVAAVAAAAPGAPTSVPSGAIVITLLPNSPLVCGLSGSATQLLSTTNLYECSPGGSGTTTDQVPSSPLAIGFAAMFQALKSPAHDTAPAAAST